MHAWNCHYGIELMRRKSPQAHQRGRTSANIYVLLTGFVFVARCVKVGGQSVKDQREALAKTCRHDGGVNLIVAYALVITSSR